MDFYVQNGICIYKQGEIEIRAGSSLTKWDFQITKKIVRIKMGFLQYKWDSRFTIHLINLFESS